MNNNIELNEVIYAEAKLVCEKIEKSSEEHERKIKN